MLTVLLYIASVVAANLFTAKYGPYASILSAFVMIGATLTLRDKLHDRWGGRSLPLRMGGLIATGGVLSVALNTDAIRIALASAAAFVVSETVDTLLYHLLRRRSWLVKANGSNVPSAAVDSLLFPALAFGGFFPVVTLGQFLAKTFGGAVWAFALQRARLVAAVGLVCLLPSLAQAQIVSLNGAWIKNDAVDAVAGEVFVASPPLKWVRPYAIFSWNTDAQATPTILVRAGHDRFIGPLQVGVGAGVIRVPGDQFRPSFSVSVFGPGRLRPYAIAAYEKPFGAWDWTTFAGLSFTAYFRR